jgi:uncharacterized LabA/DUF88 family protein
VDWFNIWNKHRGIDLKILFEYLKKYPEIQQVRFYQGTIEGKEWSLKIIEEARLAGYEVITKRSKYIKIDIRKEGHMQRIMEMLEQLLSSISQKNSDIANKIYTFKSEFEKKRAESRNTEELYEDFFALVDELDEDLRKLNINIEEFKKEIEQPIRKPKCDFDAEIAKDIALNIENFNNLILFSGDGDFASTVEYLVKERAKRVFVMFAQGGFGEIDYRDFGLIKDNDDGKREFEKGFSCFPVSYLLDKITKKEPADCSAGPDLTTIANEPKLVN